MSKPMTAKQIPASVIPELVEHLMSDRKYTPASKAHSLYVGAAFADVVTNYGGHEDDLKSVLTAALEAFNDRKTK